MAEHVAGVQEHCCQRSIRGDYTVSIRDTNARHIQGLIQVIVTAKKVHQGLQGCCCRVQPPPSQAKGVVRKPKLSDSNVSLSVKVK